MLVPIKLDEIHDVEIEALENEASGVCKINGLVVFVPKVLPKEKARIRITEIKRSFARGKVNEILKTSPKRVESICPYYDECGGCNLRHQTYEETLKFKEEKVKNAIKRIGKLGVEVDEIVPSFKENNYRNKASFKVEKNRMGFYAFGSYKLIDIDNCLLVDNSINKALKVIRTYIQNNEHNIKTVTIKHGNAMDELLIDIYSLNKEDKEILDYLLNNISNLKTVIFNDKVIYGNGYISQIINGLMFNCSAKSFFQVNDYLAEKLYENAIKLAELNKEDVVLDLYCGTGTISNLVAKHVNKVVGIELIEDAVKDAINNSLINDISNTKFICGDAAIKINSIKEDIDVMFVDPPRSGIDKKAIEEMVNLLPKKIIYISCNPVTLARDINILSTLYNVEKVLPFDMFPNTSHVECVCVMKLR